MPLRHDLFSVLHDQLMCCIFLQEITYWYLYLYLINGLVAIPVDQHIQPNPRPSRNRHTKTLLIHTCNIDIYKHSFIPRSTIDWNSLSEATVTSKTVDRLKAALLKRD
jgi:hypothetical protein